MKILCNILLFILTLSVSCNLSNSENSFLRKGNKKYNRKKFEKAEIQYRKAINKKPTSFKGRFNLSDATYKQKKFKETNEIINFLKKEEEDKKRLGMLYHNEGNTNLNTMKIDEAIGSYKNSLRKNPTDKETKYNLEYARHLKKNMKNQQKQDKSTAKNKKSDKEKNKKDNQNKNQSQQDNQQAEKKKEQIQESQGIPKETAERILNAILLDEKKAKDKMEKQKIKKQKVRVVNQKDW